MRLKTAGRNNCRIAASIETLSAPRCSTLVPELTCNETVGVLGAITIRMREARSVRNCKSDVGPLQLS